MLCMVVEPASACFTEAVTEKQANPRSVYGLIDCRLQVILTGLYCNQ